MNNIKTKRSLQIILFLIILFFASTSFATEWYSTSDKDNGIYSFLDTLNPYVVVFSPTTIPSSESTYTFTPSPQPTVRLWYSMSDRDKGIFEKIDSVKQEVNSTNNSESSLTPTPQSQTNTSVQNNSTVENQGGYYVILQTVFGSITTSNPAVVIPTPQVVENTPSGDTIPTIDAPLYCQSYFGPCYLMARTMLYNTFQPGFTSPAQVQAANGGSYFMKWSAVGSPGLKWVYPEFKNRWDSEVYTVIDDFLRQGKPVIVTGTTKRGYPHASLIVGKLNGEYLVNDSAHCEKAIPFHDIYDDAMIRGVFMYDWK